MQGTVWSSLKCISSMDRLNKTVMSNNDLQYYYKGDMNIPIGVRDMVDDTLGISNCGNNAVKLNTTINLFIEAQRQTLSEEKSVVIHVGKKSRCNTPCPELKVHKAKMHQAKTVKNLGSIVTSHGGVSESIEDRRAGERAGKGLGKGVAHTGDPE